MVGHLIGHFFLPLYHDIGFGKFGVIVEIPPPYCLLFQLIHVYTMISLLLTKNCHYAILVAIEEGDQFGQQDDKEIYVKAKLDFPYSDDIIPINSTLCTPFTPLSTANPQFKSTLVYYISNQYLKRLRKKQSLVTLEVFRLSMDSTEELLGVIELKVTEAKEVIMKKGERRMAQIERFVGDKGEWRSFGNKTKSKARLKCGLFLVEMPHSSAMAAVAASSAEELSQQQVLDVNRSVSSLSSVQRAVEATNIRPRTSSGAWSPTSSLHYYQPQQYRSTESRAGSELGFELRSQLSDTLRASDDSSTNSSVRDLISPATSNQHNVRLNEDEEEDEDYDKIADIEGISTLNEDVGTTIGGNKYLALGTGEDQFILQLHIVSATHIANIVDKFVPSLDMIEKAYFSFTFGDDYYKCLVDYSPENTNNHRSDTWVALDNMTCVFLQGEIDEVQDWLSESPLKLQLVVKLINQDEEVNVAFAELYLEDVGFEMIRKTGILYDKEGNWYPNDKMEFAKLELEFGLTEGWDDNMSPI
ncbi:hypothetical protein BDF20DRAFT_863804 [Mycotypha africana]|uniref:uncharacterized protein n=1 Tax=Mycotypha africana TaxID=64632 RepID=UPI002300A9FE|nr:uncharacterized protein BDF20DRAFT_863804 [Mycotypha africana]KAI8981892.1 hypothetical protein BDF20DRAFT_863804 [Mycotypha africana]